MQTKAHPRGGIKSIAFILNENNYKFYLFHVVLNNSMRLTMSIKSD